MYSLYHTSEEIWLLMFHIQKSQRTLTPSSTGPITTDTKQNGYSYNLLSLFGHKYKYKYWCELNITESRHCTVSLYHTAEEIMAADGSYPNLNAH